MTKALLGEKFKELVAKKGFEKTDDQDDHRCSRGNSPDIFIIIFQDKYEVMEWLFVGRCI